MAVQNRVGNVILEGVRVWPKTKNFSGRETKYNDAGNRNFCIFIDDPDLAKKLLDEGWNIRILKPRDPDEEAQYYLSVAVNYKHIPPKIYMVTSRAKVLLNEETVGELDFAEFRQVDLVIRPRYWGDNNDRIKAYVKTMYVTVEEDEFADKYAAEESPDDEEALPFN